MNAPENVISSLLWVIGGLGLFLFGIEMMGRALRKAAGSALRKGLGFLTSTRFHGVLTGIGITGLLQSSSASTVMVVGFISAGLLTFQQSIGLILGSNIGSTITPQITAMDIDALAIPLIGIGFLGSVFSRKRLLRKLGGAIMGFGILFFGLTIMKFAVSNYLTEIEGWMKSALDGGVQGFILAFGISTAITCIIQSSAATIAMLQVLASDNAVAGLDLAIPIILGAHVGTCITAILASLNAQRAGRRAALAHLVFNLVGVATTLCLFKVYTKLIPMTSDSLSVQIANCHTAIQMFNVLLFVPFTKSYAKLITMVLPGEDKLDAAPKFLAQQDVANAGVALGNVRKEIKRLTSLCLEASNDAVIAFFTGNEVKQEEVLKQEDLVDDLYNSIVDYVMEISEYHLPPELANDPPYLMHILNDVERIGDHAENIVELGQAFSNKKSQLSGTAEDEIRNVLSQIMEMGHETLSLFDSIDKEKVNRILKLRHDLNDKTMEIIKQHDLRLKKGECSIIAGIVFVDLITNLRRVSNHLRNVAVSLGNHPEKPDRAEI